MVEPIPYAFGGTGDDWKIGDELVYPTPRTTAMTENGLVLASENGDEIIEYKEFVNF